MNKAGYDQEGAPQRTKARSLDKSPFISFLSTIISNIPWSRRYSEV
jgi:hypothetical protein